MRVGFLISGSLDALTGGYIYDRQLVDYLRQKGHIVDIIHLPGRNYLDRWLQDPFLPFLKKLSHLSVDILLQDELDHPALILLNNRLKRHISYPIISIVHNLRSCELRTQWQNHFYQRIEKQYLLSVNGFIFNSHTTRQTVENLVGSPSSSVIAYPCGNRLSEQITESVIKDRSRALGPLRILFLGNLLKGKGLHILLDALEQLPENSYVLTVTGDLNMDRSYVKQIKEIIRRHNLNERVFITGPLNNSELASRLKDNHVLAVPSFYEGFGIAYLEGMAFGLPAIGTTAGGAKEIITNGLNGFLISPGDSRTLSQYLRELYSDRDRLVSMGLNALRRFNTHPTWQITGDSILNYLQSL